MKLSVAIDGPAGAGKSTIAKIIANKFGLMYINTGAMYRVVTLKALQSSISPSEIDSLCSIIDSLSMRFENEKIFVNEVELTNEINTPEINSKVSDYALVPEVRKRLVFLQREMSKNYNVIMDGRDIGTVVLKEANLKFFITASAEERAKRRYEELINKGFNVVYEQILNDILKRDYQDSHRETDPLIKASDAIEIDTSKLDIDQVVSLLSDYIDKYKAKGEEIE